MMMIYLIMLKSADVASTTRVPARHKQQQKKSFLFLSLGIMDLFIFHKLFFHSFYAKSFSHFWLENVFPLSGSK
jgi:hypothetical protein